LKIRFQADADLRQPIITGLKRRELALDFRTAQEANLAGLDDPTVLGMAADEGRLLVSHDVNTMPEHFARFIETQTSSGVILISPQLSYRDAIEGLLRVWITTEAEDWQNVLSFLPR
jgi:hypothetical protein